MTLDLNSILWDRDLHRVTHLTNEFLLPLCSLSLQQNIMQSSPALFHQQQQQSFLPPQKRTCDREKRWGKEGVFFVTPFFHLGEMRHLRMLFRRHITWLLSPPPQKKKKNVFTKNVSFKFCLWGQFHQLLSVSPIKLFPTLLLTSTQKCKLRPAFTLKALCCVPKRSP